MGRLGEKEAGDGEDREEEREAGWRHGVRWLGGAGRKESKEGVWIRNQEVTPGRTGGRERNRKIGR